MQAEPFSRHIRIPVKTIRGREFVRTAGSVAIVAAIFGFAMPRFASYSSVLASMSAMTWPQALLVGAGRSAVRPPA